MRSLAVVLLAGCTFGLTSAAADTDEDQAKEVAVAFMKAVRAKDLDAIMKTVDYPFMLVVDRKVKLFNKTDDLKAELKMRLEGLKDPEKFPTEADQVIDGTAIRKKIEAKKDADLKKSVEMVLGDKSYLVTFKGRGGLFVRIKDGKAKVVGVPD